MSDTPTKTYPPECLHALIDDHEAEQAGATPEESSAVETKGDAMSDDLVHLAHRWPERTATHYEGCEADHVGCLVKTLGREVERLRAERAAAQADCVLAEYRKRWPR